MALKVTMARVLILICFLFSVKIVAQQKVSFSKGKSIPVPLMDTILICLTPQKMEQYRI